MVIPKTEALHDSDGFRKDPRRPYPDTYACTAGRCTHRATVRTDRDFYCDTHWLFCNRCGTGLFVGIEYVYCPRCHAGDFANMR